MDRDALLQEGHTWVRLLDAGTLRQLQELVASVDLPADHPFFASPAHAWGAEAERVDRAAKALVAERLAELFPGWRPFMVAVTSKGAGGMPILFHWDWTYTDERRERAVFLWCPLVDVDERNGVLEVVPGSHRWTDGLIRPSRGLGTAEVTEAHQDEFRRLAVRRPMRAGDALVFDPGALHGSGPNRTDRVRPAVTIALVPQDAVLLHFHQPPGGPLQGAVVDEGFFTSHPYASAPEGYPATAAWARAVTTADLDGPVAAALAGAQR